MLSQSLKKSRIKELLPGLIMCIVLAYMGKFIGGYVPKIGGASLAIFLGIAAGNTFASKKLYAAGAKFAEGNLLSYSIVLLGGTLSAQTLLELGLSGVSYIILQMLITITAAILIGKWFKFGENFRLLMASGNAVCGSSAIASTAPVIGASDEDKGIVITIVNVTGTVLMLLLPYLAGVLFNFETLRSSALIGGVLQSVGQVVASGAMVNEGVKDLSTIFKIVRVIFLVFVVLGFGSMKKHSSGTPEAPQNKSKVKVPWYVTGFFIMCGLYTIGVLTPSIAKFFKTISNNFELIALAGIGMRVNVRELLRQGPRASLYALALGTVQITSALILINLFLK